MSAVLTKTEPLVSFLAETCGRFSHDQSSNHASGLSRETRHLPTSARFRTGVVAYPHGDTMISKHALFVKKNKDKWREQGRCRRCGKPANGKSSCERCLRLHKASQQRRALKRKLQVQQAYGGRCSHCGTTDQNVLCLDHVNGGGRKHREQLGGPQRVYGHAIQNGYPKTFRLLCYNCNYLAYFDSIPPPPNRTAVKAREWRQQFKRKVFERYGGANCSCGEADIRVLCLDHKDGGGVAHRKSIKGSEGTKVLRWAHRNGYPPIFQVLCANCNSKKGNKR